MAYDPEKILRYCIEQQEKERIEEEKRQEEERGQKYAALEQEPPKERSWQEHMYVDTDKPGTMDNGTATLWYVIIMVIGAVFNDRWVIWIMATIIWWNHINRKKRRQKEWDEKHSGGNK